MSNTVDPVALTTEQLNALLDAARSGPNTWSITSDQIVPLLTELLALREAHRPMGAGEARSPDARDAVLIDREEAAKIAEQTVLGCNEPWQRAGDAIATAIRALQSPTPVESPAGKNAELIKIARAEADVWASHVGSISGPRVAGILRELADAVEAFNRSECPWTDQVASPELAAALDRTTGLRPDVADLITLFQRDLAEGTELHPSTIERAKAVLKLALMKGERQ